MQGAAFLSLMSSLDREYTFEDTFEIMAQTMEEMIIYQVSLAIDHRK